MDKIIKNTRGEYYCPLGEHFVNREDYDINRGICYKHDKKLKGK